MVCAVSDHSYDLAEIIKDYPEWCSTGIVGVRRYVELLYRVPDDASRRSVEDARHDIECLTNAICGLYMKIDRLRMTADIPASYVAGCTYDETEESLLLITR